MRKRKPYYHKLITLIVFIMLYEKWKRYIVTDKVIPSLAVDTFEEDDVYNVDRNQFSYYFYILYKLLFCIVNIKIQIDMYGKNE